MQVLDCQHVEVSQVELSSATIDEKLTIYALIECGTVWSLSFWQLVEFLTRWWRLSIATIWVLLRHGLRGGKLATSEHVFIKGSRDCISLVLLRFYLFVLFYLLRSVGISSYCRLSQSQRINYFIDFIIAIRLVLRPKKLCKRCEFILRSLSLLRLWRLFAPLLH